jgi:hypothetical protein
MTTPRKLRSDSTTAQVLAFQHKRTFEVPEGVILRECDKPYWNAALACRDDWQLHELVLLSHLAQALADHEKLRREIETEGCIIDFKPNVKFAMQDTLSRRAMTLTRHLQIHARATRGEARDAAKRQPVPMIDDDLISRPK